MRSGRDLCWIRWLDFLGSFDLRPQNLWQVRHLQWRLSWPKKSQKMFCQLLSQKGGTTFPEGSMFVVMWSSNSLGTRMAVMVVNEPVPVCHTGPIAKLASRESWRNSARQKLARKRWTKFAAKRKDTLLPIKTERKREKPASDKVMDQRNRNLQKRSLKRWIRSSVELGVSAKGAVMNLQPVDLQKHRQFLMMLVKLPELEVESWTLRAMAMMSKFQWTSECCIV